MIRSTLTAHLAEIDRQELTLQINDRDIGLLASQHQRYYVMSGNRRVQMIAGLLTQRDDPASVSSTRALLRLWLMTFRDLQINGLARFPQCVESRDLDADFALLMDAHRVFVWCQRNQGVYLLRGNHLYRQQPTFAPQHELLRSFGSHLDFYAFKPHEGDDLLVIDPSFIDLFDCADLEAMFTDIRQVNIAMTELTRLAANFGYSSDKTWFSAQIQKLEPEPDVLSADSRGRVAGRRTREGAGGPWFRRIRWSKVVPLTDGNVLILPSELERQRRRRDVQPAQTSRQPKPPRFTNYIEREDADRSDKVDIVESEARSHSQRSREKIAETYGRKVTRLDRVKEWNVGGVRDRIIHANRKLMNLIPSSRGLSILTYIVIWLLILVIVVAIFVSIKGRRGSSDMQQDSKPKVSAVENSEQVKIDFEIDVEVRASSLRIVAAPNSDELVATVQRGERVVQLTHPKDGWVMVRTSDERVGYVPEALLLSPEEGDQ
ncbi:MAG TPA: SH3 domain-containing protein [Clostridiaceae bacterium]|nr:SH3 domain-containing protein [Clostridiaceae bacterium]